MSTRRQQKVARVVREAVSEAVTCHLNDPRITALASVTKVRMAPDLRSADVYLSFFGGDETEQNKTFVAIKHARSKIQSLLGERLQSKFCPVLHFHVDEDFKKSLETLNIIEQVSKELKEKESSVDDESPDRG